MRLACKHEQQAWSTKAIPALFGSQVGEDFE